MIVVSAKFSYPLGGRFIQISALYALIDEVCYGNDAGSVGVSLR